MLCASHLHPAMNTKCCVPLTCTLLSLCLAFNIVWLWLLLYLVMGSFPLQGLGLWRIETKKIDLRKTLLCWNCETLQTVSGRITKVKDTELGWGAAWKYTKSLFLNWNRMDKTIVQCPSGSLLGMVGNYMAIGGLTGVLSHVRQSQWLSAHVLIHITFIL